MIPPGGEGQIKVTLHPKGPAVDIEKSVTVETDDPETPRFSLTMKGQLLFDLVAAPTAVNISGLRAGQTGTERFKLSLAEGSKAAIKSIELEDDEHFILRRISGPEKGPLPGQELQYEVEFKGRQTVGSESTRVKVVTDGKYTPELYIPVRASVAKNLRYQKSVNFRRKDGVLQERELHISARQGDAPKIEKVVDPDGLLDVEVLEADGPLVTIRFNVKVDAFEALGDEDKKRAHQLVIHTSDEEEPKLLLNYRIPALNGRANGGAKVGKPVSIGAGQRRERTK